MPSPLFPGKANAHQAVRRQVLRFSHKSPCPCDNDEHCQAGRWLRFPLGSWRTVLTPRLLEKLPGQSQLRVPASARLQRSPGRSQSPPDIYEVLLKGGGHPKPRRNVNWLKLLPVSPLSPSYYRFIFICFPPEAPGLG